MVLHSTYVFRVPYSCGVVLVFWFWREIGFGVTYVLSVQYSCAVVSVFLLWLFGVTYVLSVHYSCAVLSVFYCGEKANFVQIPYSRDRFSIILRTFFVENEPI